MALVQVIRDVTPMVLSRALKLCNFLDWKDIKVKYTHAQSYASLVRASHIISSQYSLLL